MHELVLKESSKQFPEWLYQSAFPQAINEVPVSRIMVWSQNQWWDCTAFSRTNKFAFCLGFMVVKELWCFWWQCHPSQRHCATEKRYPGQKPRKMLVFHSEQVQGHMTVCNSPKRKGTQGQNNFRGTCTCINSKYCPFIDRRPNITYK